MIPDSFKQDLLNRVDIVDVVSRYVQLKKAGANHQGLCPFHTERSPSFTVSPAKQFYHCFGCGAHGNAIGFLMAYAGMGYVDAVKDLAAGAGMTVPEAPRSPQEAQRRERETDLYAVMDKAMEFYRAQLKESARAVAYLKGRGLTGEIAARFRIGYAPDDWQALKAVFVDYQDKSLADAGLVIDNDEGRRYDRFRDRVMFPILNQRGAVIGFGGRVLDKPGEAAPPGSPKYLNSPETALFEKGRELYGLAQAREAIRTAGRVIVVEGYMDVVALAQYGVGYAVAALGTATTPEHVAKLLRAADEIVFCFDGDAAGRKAARRALEVCLPLALDHKPVRFLFLPAEHDPDSFVREHGKEAFEKRVVEAQPLSGFLLGELRAAADLSNAEGRSKFLSEAKPHLHRVAAPGLKLQLLKEVAELGRVSQDEAERLLDLPANLPRTYARAAPARVAAPQVNALEVLLLRCVLAKPLLIEQVEFDLLDPALAETELLARIADLREEAELSSGMLIEQLQGSEHEALLARAQAALLEHGPGEESAEQELRHALAKLRIKRKDEECNTLKMRADSDRSQIAAYSKSLEELRRLKDLLNAPSGLNPRQNSSGP